MKVSLINQLIHIQSSIIVSCILCGHSKCGAGIKYIRDEGNYISSIASVYNLCLVCSALMCMNVACTRTCQNGGTLNSSSCTCNCVDAFSGVECESEI